MSDDRGNGRTPLLLVEEDREVAFYLGEVAREGGPILVLGAASGRIASALSEQGYEVTGVDPSPAMVRLAEERRAVQRKRAGPLAFVVSDLRAVRLKRRFPTVIAPQNALGLYSNREALESLFATVTEHLLPGGVFLFDCLLAPGGEKDRPSAEGRAVFLPHLRETSRHPKDRRASIRRLGVQTLDRTVVLSVLQASGLEAKEEWGSFGKKARERPDGLWVVLARQK